ncbi:MULTISPECIES: gliding motility protein GldL [unclassified Mucilaginibacter]|uniref:type IX secretion system motor protein PorL/GldL n=1 Tax=unclassified Mucilaginibacter TaxID=2617802 RepID=UPI002AC9799B|nr:MULTISPECIES: gliding motility protein GldL [unclassified Mucilaginibacter]MEB0262626.1 gliding motility protein GldL [Mucilaginibacter sp. 10I4]MEB0279245.1 gliding motility protein GldL [Mucilaginibacter sp. 10B2]MEB0300655.1 gliding motility protein GldL [Mucilaginibacter sp. 5C4]WPX23242.1 gliding motility protein GldL [Mucilaginibacter sp. 5C4]
MAGKKKPFGIGNIISIGATVVIIGLLFKIQHWKFASEFITLGLGTEAILFFILGLQREDKEVDWVRVYPELNEDFSGELPKSSSRPAISGGDNFSNTAALDKMLSDAKIGPELIGSLGDGLRTFGDKVNAISRVTDAGDATVAFTNKVKQATASYDGLSAAFEKASANLNEMANTNIDSKAYHDQVNNLAKNLSSLNAVYELELQDSSAHLKAMNSFYKNLSLTMNNFNESLDDSKQFKEEVGRLAKNLASLNSVYGNMLTAMNQPRVN